MDDGTKHRVGAHSRRSIYFAGTRLDWWDTRQDEPRTAVLPAMTIEVLPAPTVEQPPVPAPSEPAVLERQSGQPGTQAVASGFFWPSVSMGLLLAWLATLFAWWRSSKRRNGSALQQRTTTSLTTARAAKQAVRQACADNNPAAAAQALLAWANALWPTQPPRHLGALAARLEPQAGALVRGVDRALYAPTPTPWQGQPLWQAVQRGLPQQRLQATAQPVLTPLYPERS
ncbi:MAG: hypothetical protein R3F37_00200 [Candidatus Competibacteraceae bacterium]